MKAAKIVAWICLLIMTVGIVSTFVNGDFLVDGKEILENPWGVMSLIDLYVGFTLFSMWIVYREKTIWKIIIWIISMMALGFWIGSIYVLKALYESKGDWSVVFHGIQRSVRHRED